MKSWIITASLSVMLASPFAFAGNPQVEFTTTQGVIQIELYPKAAPKTVENFLTYVKSDFYKDTIFHRVIPGFVIQGGGMTADLKEKPTNPPIQNEAANGLKNTVGTLSMARTMEPHSASSQFFINLKDNPSLDYTQPQPIGYGYAVFGKVIKGMDVVNKIAAQPTGFQAGYADVPKTPIVVTQVRVVESKAKPTKTKKAK